MLKSDGSPREPGIATSEQREIEIYQHKERRKTEAVNNKGKRNYDEAEEDGEQRTG